MTYKTDYPSIIQIGDCLLSSEIFTEKFCCDYEKCKGACCIIGDSGAPLEKEEAAMLEREYPSFGPYMSGAGKNQIRCSGYCTIDSDGDLVTPLVNGEECAYAMFEGDHCFCAIERAWINGKTPFRKPASCRLYPIRISRLSNGLTAFNLHRWELCRDAFIKGRKEGIPVYRFLKEPLTAVYGEEFYREIEAAAGIFAGKE